MNTVKDLIEALARLPPELPIVGDDGLELWTIAIEVGTVYLRKTVYTSPPHALEFTTKKDPPNEFCKAVCIKFEQPFGEKK